MRHLLQCVHSYRHLFAANTYIKKKTLDHDINKTKIQVFDGIGQGRFLSVPADTGTELQWELDRLCRMVQESEKVTGVVSLDEIVAVFSPNVETPDSVFNFIREQIRHKKRLGKVRSAETYRSMLNSLMHFRKGRDLTFDMMDGGLMELYEAWMQKGGLTRNTTSFYMRILRTNYKQAVEKGITADCHPFRHVYCGMDKTVKRSIPFSEIKKINGLDLSRKPNMDFARDMFMFSFCTRGMSFIDMAYLKKTDLNNGCLAYRRWNGPSRCRTLWTNTSKTAQDTSCPSSQERTAANAGSTRI